MEKFKLKKNVAYSILMFREVISNLVHSYVTNLSSYHISNLSDGVISDSILRMPSGSIWDLVYDNLEEKFKTNEEQRNEKV